MRSLKQALQDHELIVLRVIGEWWELDLTGADKAGSINELALTLERLDMPQELSYLPPEEAAAIQDLIQNNGRIPVAKFARSHGDVRQMGPAKLEREEPWFDPVTVAEALWYRGWLYRGFDKTAEGMIEFYYLPDELFDQLGSDVPEEAEPAAASTPPKRPPVLPEAELADFEETEPEFDEDNFVDYDETGEAEGSKEEAPLFEEDDYSYLEEPQYVPLAASDPDEPTPVEVQPQDPSNQPFEGELTAVTPPTTQPASPTDAVDDLTTILIMAQKIGLSSETSGTLDQFLLNKNKDRRSLLINLATEMEMVRQSAQGLRTTRTAVEWLQKSREQQLRDIADAWSRSQWNELRHTPQIQCEGDGWENDPILARNGILDALPRDTNWYRIYDLIQFIKSKTPDFQRPDGDYHTWYVRDTGTNQYITGFENWEFVEGRLIAFLLKGPLSWLGLLLTTETAAGLVFRLTDRLLEWMAETEPVQDEVRVPLRVESDGVIIIPLAADRYHRFQAARITDPVPVSNPKEFAYRLTPHSLSNAQSQGITPDRVLQFLETASRHPLPPGIKRAIDRWGERGVEGRLENVVVLRVRDAAILQTLRDNPKTRDYLGESLGDLAAAVRPADREHLRSAVAQLGLLLDVDI